MNLPGPGWRQGEGKGGHGDKAEASSHLLFIFKLTLSI